MQKRVKIVKHFGNWCLSQLKLTQKCQKNTEKQMKIYSNKVNDRNNVSQNFKTTESKKGKSSNI